MGEFYHSKLTDAGMLLMAKVQTGQELKFLHVQMGDYEATDYRQEIGNVRVDEIPIVSAKVTGSGWAKLEFVVNSTDAGFWFRELAIIAEDPQLGPITYAYTYAKWMDLPGGGTVQVADWVPQIGTSAIFKPRVTIFVRIDNATNVTAWVYDVNYVSAEDFDAHIHDPDTHEAAFLMRMPILSVPMPVQHPKAWWAQILRTRTVTTPYSDYIYEILEALPYDDDAVWWTYIADAAPPSEPFSNVEDSSLIVYEIE